MDVTQRYVEWLYARLSGDTQLMALALGGVHENVAPAGTVDPYIVFSMVDNHDVNAVGQTRALTESEWDVKAVREGTSYTTLAPIAARIDALLHDVLGGVVISSHRTATIRYPEYTGGASYRHLGGTYRVQIQ